MEKIVSSHARIRFQDCDPFNHLNNSKYIDYFMNAREYHVRTEYGLDIFFTAKSLHVEMRMWDEGRAKLKSILWTQFIHIDLKTLRAADHSGSLMKLFEGVLQSVPESSLTERIAGVS